MIVSNDDKPVYDWLEMEAVCPRDVLEKMPPTSGERLDVYINSPGGDVFAGSEIYEALRAYKGPVKIHVIHAASAASMIMCAAWSEITPTGMVMIHNTSCYAWGDYHDMDKASEFLQKANKAVAAAYVAKTGKPEKEILAMMDRETWLTAAQAVEYGLVDAISSSQVSLAAGIGMLPRETIDKIKNSMRRPPEKAGAFSLEQLKAQAQLDYLKIKGRNRH